LAAEGSWPPNDHIHIFAIPILSPPQILCSMLLPDNAAHDRRLWWERGSIEDTEGHPHGNPYKPLLLLLPLLPSPHTYQVRWEGEVSWQTNEHPPTPVATFFVGLEFEVRALCLQNRHSTTWVRPPVHFALVILEIGSHKLCQSWPWTMILLISASQIGRITGVSH
jgi:hypothetical protein